MNVIELPLNLRQAHAIAYPIRATAERMEASREQRARAVCCALRAWANGASCGMAIARGKAALRAQGRTP